MNTATCGPCGRRVTETTFWSHVDRGPDCWVWTAGRNAYGYGVQCHTLAHRLAWHFANGPIVGTLLVVRHHCDEPPCVRPEHLALGTQADNIRDMDSRGRRRAVGLAGEANPHAMLTEQTVRQIRSRYATGRCTQREVAAEFGVSRTLVCDVVLRRSWAHVV